MEWQRRVLPCGQRAARSPNTGTLSSSTVYYLSTASGVAADAQWEFFVNLKFATSGANYVDVYLMSDGQDLSTPGNGYFVRIGETSDHVALYKMTAGVPGLLVASPDGIVNSSTDNPFRIKVTRDAADLWTLYYDDGAMGTYLIAGTITEASFTSSAWFGVCITQSTAASAVNNHFFDDFYAGPIILDTSPPTVVSVTATGADEVDVLWSEPLSPTAIGNYDILPSIGVSSAIQDALIPALVHLTPTASISANVPYTVFISMAEDLAGNVAPDNNAGFTWTVLVPAQPGDVVMNELMPDPDPPVGLPNAEFVELLNTTTDQTFDLAGWTITDGSSSGTLPAVVLPPGGFVILASTANARPVQRLRQRRRGTCFPFAEQRWRPLGTSRCQRHGDRWGRLFIGLVQRSGQGGGGLDPGAQGPAHALLRPGQLGGLHQRGGRHARRDQTAYSPS
jgi:hypothetical protein